VHQISATHISESDVDTRRIGEEFAMTLPQGTVVAFCGDLGAGKTTFIKGMAKALTGSPQEDVCSPTFTYLNVYEGPKTLYHFDLYRLEHPESFMNMGFDEFFSCGYACCIEWSERIPTLLPSATIKVTISYIDEHKRRIEITTGSAS
jgi:tRNA threonylcarbamoyladenosine biosynthesis protein TsaE